MAPPIEIVVPSTSTSTAGGLKPFTIYSISIRQPLRSYIVPKRYSDFVQLHSTLISQAGEPPPAALPKKSWIKNTVSSPELTESRRQGLEAYLRAINDAADSRWRRTEAWRIFLNLPNTTEARSGPSSAAGPRHADLQAAVVDPNVWLDMHRELKGQLNDTRQALRKRDAAVSVQAQHEASAEVKRWLVRSGTIIIALEAGLKAASESGNAKSGSDELKQTAHKTSKLGEGEIRRRKDLLSAARKERDGLERQLNSNNSRASDSNSPAEPDASSQPQRPLLLSKGSSRPQSARRVLGAPLKETEQTRQLDNDQVLQLQQQIMQAQDEDVTELARIARRLKDMGLQMNEELDEQNRLLSVLDKDTDRVTDKINIAKKRIDKIN